VLALARAAPQRLDRTRPGERAVVEACLAVARHAPTGSNWQNWHFVVVTDPAKRAALAELYRRAVEIYLTLPVAAPNLPFEDPARQAIQRRVGDSLVYLAEHLHEVPVFVIPCIGIRTDGAAIGLQPASSGSLLPPPSPFIL